MSVLDLSVVLCTRNRSAVLAGALAALAAQDTRECSMDIVVVDNGSTDETARVIKDAAATSPVPLRSIAEPRPGLSYARNAGVAASAAALVAFTDDDVRADRGWARAIVRAARERPDVAFVGGPVRPRWPQRPPAWMTRGDWGPLALQDHGPEPFETGPARAVCLIGANLAVRRDALARTGGFDTDVQRIDAGLGSTEDHELQARLWALGYKGLYVPTAVMEAEIAEERLSKSYHRRWHRGHGRFHARMRLDGAAPAYYAREIAREAAACLIDHARGRRADAFRHEARAWFALGFIDESLAPRARVVSIVIPCHNQEGFVREAAASALAQTYHPVEVLVVDDGSTDGSAAAAERPGVTVMRQRRSGVAGARNAGLRATRGEYVIFLDADDRLLPDAAAAGVAALRRNPPAAFAAGAHYVIDEAGRAASSRRPPADAGRRDSAYETLLESNVICVPGAVIYRRDPLERAGGFPSGVDGAADYALYLRLARDHPVAIHAEPVVEYRRHPASMSGDPARMLRETLAVHGRERRQATAAGHRAAWRAGRRFWRDFYGEQAIDRLRTDLRSRRWNAAARTAIALVRHAPGVLRRHFGRKLALMVSPVQRPRYRT